MTCEHCCGADKLFDLKGAKKELKRYQKSGPTRVTKRLIQALSAFDKQDRSLLDIGGGIGAIAWHFQEKGANHTTDVDASSGYLQVAREYALSRGWGGKTQFKQGDFTDVAHELSTFDFVTMDKVVCCYPDYELILQNALGKSKKIIALTFPLGGPIANFFRWIGGLIMKIKNNPFRPYVHPYQKMEELILQNGFLPVHQSISFPWRVWVFERK